MAPPRRGAIHSECAGVWRSRARVRQASVEAWDTAPLDAVSRNDYPVGVIASASCSGAKTSRPVASPLRGVPPRVTGIVKGPIFIVIGGKKGMGLGIISTVEPVTDAIIGA